MQDQNTPQFPNDDADNTPQAEPNEAPQSRIGITNDLPQLQEQLIAQCQHIVRASKHFDSFRKRLNVKITSAKVTEEFSAEIGCPPTSDLIYDESVELAARSYLLSLTRYVVLRSNRAQPAREVAKRMCAVVVSNIGALESETMDYYRTEGVACALVEIFELEIQRNNTNALFRNYIKGRSLL